MSFILIAEPDEVNASRIRTILESLELDFEYELVTSAEAAIEMVEKRTPDVFIGDMKMPFISAAELFSMIGMMAPEAPRIVMTDGGNIQETVDFMNECQAFKIILKPCRVADDLLVPIRAALSYQKQCANGLQPVGISGLKYESIQEKYDRLCAMESKNADELKHIQHAVLDMINANMNANASMPENVKERVKRWYEWMLGEYMRLVLKGYGDYEKVLQAQTAFSHEPKYNNTFQMRKKTSNEIEPDCMNVIAYVLRLATGVCKDLQASYQIQVLIDETDKAYILRIRYRMEKDANGIELPSAHRVHNEEIRRQIRYATKLGIAAAGCKTAVIQKQTEDILNVAIAK